MRIVFAKSKWEMWDDPLSVFLERARGDGFEVVELFLGPMEESPDEINRGLRAHGMGLIAQIFTEGRTIKDHLRSLEQQFERAQQCNPLLINHHIGRDIFTFEENVRLIERMIALGDETGIVVTAETHRMRPTYSAPDTRRYLEAIPRLLLTADFSHWMVVHESDLRDQDENVEAAIRRSHHIHARVGYEEGPQITDPRAPEWEGHVARHVELWQRIVAYHRSAGTEVLTVTPEFGPPNYMHTLPFTRQPVANVWGINVYMRDLLATALEA